MGKPPGNFKHGHGKPGKQTRTYMTWKGMRCRCQAKTGPAVRDYVEKGITVCKEWDDFLVFLRDMGEQPPNTTIDRIDGSKGYSKENCRWATVKQQAENRAITIWVTIKGECKTLKQWCNDTKIASYKLAHKRIKNGWDAEKAIITPPIRSRKFFVRPTR